MPKNDNAPGQLVWVYTEVEVETRVDAETGQPLKSPGDVLMRFERYHGDDIPEGFERETLTYLRRKA